MTGGLQVGGLGQNLGPWPLVMGRAPPRLGPARMGQADVCDVRGSWTQADRSRLAHWHGDVRAESRPLLCTGSVAQLWAWACVCIRLLCAQVIAWGHSTVGGRGRHTCEWRLTLTFTWEAGLALVTRATGQPLPPAGEGDRVGQAGIGQSRRWGVALWARRWDQPKSQPLLRDGQAEAPGPGVGLPLGRAAQRLKTHGLLA